MRHSQEIVWERLGDTEQQSPAKSAGEVKKQRGARTDTQRYIEKGHRD